MAAAGYVVFDTAIGRCGLAWNERGLAAIQLPEPDEERLVRGLLRRTGELPRAEPPAGLRGLPDRIARHLGGEPDDFRDVPLDLDGLPPFHAAVYRLARKIGPGKTTTYGELASRLGKPGAARAVGHAMAKNPIPLVIPCHRVLAKGGGAGGFSAHGGVATKRRLLQLEGAG